jgi:hypothetical protein
MKTTKTLFSELMYDFQSECSNEFELPKLTLRELLALAKLLGCPSCGSKETVIVRLLAQRELRLKLARFTDNPEDLAISLIDGLPPVLMNPIPMSVSFGELLSLPWPRGYSLLKR